MKYTNKHNLPQIFVDLLTKDDYDYNKDKNAISTTELIDSPKIRILKRLHWDEIEEDVSDMIWLFLGKMAHKAIESAASLFHFTEQRISMAIDGWVVSGKPDFYDLESKELIDFKVTSVWSYVFAAEKPAFEQQLNVYRYLIMNVLGKPVEKMSNFMVLRDWQKSAMIKSTGDYPLIPFASISQPIWANNTTKSYIQERLFEHRKAEELIDNIDSVECTEQERWAKPTTWAVYSKKKDGTWKERADKVLDNYDLALLEMDETGNKEIRERKGTDTRCTGYCPVAKWCSYYKKKYGEVK